MREVSAALRSVPGLERVATLDDARAVALRAGKDPALRVAMDEALRAVAVRHGLSFTPAPAGELSDAELAGVAGGVTPEQWQQLGAWVDRVKRDGLNDEEKALLMMFMGPLSLLYVFQAAFGGDEYFLDDLGRRDR